MQLLAEWSALTQIYDGWTLTEIQNLSHRERANWLELARIRHVRSSSGE